MIHKSVAGSSTIEVFGELLAVSWFSVETIPREVREGGRGDTHTTTAGHAVLACNPVLRRLKQKITNDRPGYVTQ